MLLGIEGSGMSSDWGLDEVSVSWLIGLLFVEAQESLDGVVELLVEVALLLGNFLHVSLNTNVGVIKWLLN